MGRTIGVYFDDDLLEKGQTKAASQGGKFSTYVQRLLQADLENKQPEPLSPTVIVDLARVLVGELDAQKIAKALGDENQPEKLQAWLRSMIESRETDEGVQMAQAIREMHAKQESPARRIMRERAERRAKREDALEFVCVIAAPVGELAHRKMVCSCLLP